MTAATGTEQATETARSIQSLDTRIGVVSGMVRRGEMDELAGLLRIDHLAELRRDCISLWERETGRQWGAWGS